MSIVVTTPTGNIGRVVTKQLLDQGQKVTIVARDPDKVADFARRGARVVKGSHADADLMIEATRGAKALFVLTPPDVTCTDIRAHYERFANASAKAIKKNDISYVVHLSSIGADIDHDNGPVLGLHYAEKILEKAAENITQLRAGYFMENTLGQVNSIKTEGHMYTSMAGELPIPMVATRDIGLRAADLLVNRTWRGRQVVELQGPVPTSYDQVARAITELLGKEVSHITVPAEQLESALKGMGFSETMAHSFVDLSHGLEKGAVKFHQRRSDDDVTRMSYPEFAKNVFKTVYESV